VQRENDSKQFRIKELENNVEDLKNKLAESQKAIETNQSSKLYINSPITYLYIVIQWLNKSLNETQRPTGPRAPLGNTTRFNPASTSPYRPGGTGGDDFGAGLGASGRYSTTFNADKYNKYQTEDYPGAGATSFGLGKTYGNAGGNDFLGKLDRTAGKSIDYDHQEPTPNKVKKKI